MFSLFLTDIELHLQSNLNSGITVEQLSIYILLFADDAVILSETAEGLQSSLDKIQSYCEKWKLTVNILKTKIVFFHKGGRFRPVCRCSHNGQILEVVTSFNYLGIVLSNRGSFIHSQLKVLGQCVHFYMLQNS